ncbi:MAG: sugar-binding domain-containing protein [Pirellulaceae bacterium]|nr:sugar-binding domain-containing protein [Pirellulaceae bacterium]MDP6722910.1 sugar-binding domain-containing protein [Pirellulaceae bacterium]
MFPDGSATLESRLKHCFNLRHVLVIPSIPMSSPSGEAADHTKVSEEIRALQHEQLGQVAAELVSKNMQGNMGLGLGGGTGVAAFSRHLPGFCPTVALNIFALSVSSREPFSLCSSSVTAVAASLLSNEFQQRAVRRRRGRSADTSVPKVVGNALRLPKRSRDVRDLVADADCYYDSAMDRTDMIVTGIGAIESCWVLDESERLNLKNDGAVGDILYDLFGEGGTPVAFLGGTPTFPFGITRLRRMVTDGKDVIVICTAKARAAYHAISGRHGQFVTGLVTDESTATDILAIHASAGR